MAPPTPLSWPRLPASADWLLPRLALLTALTLLWLGCGEGGSGVQVPALEIRTATTGPEPDPDGYTVSIDGGAARPIGPTDTLLIDPLAAAGHTVTLAGLSANCAVAGENPVSITVTPGQTAVVVFAVTCGPSSGTLVVTTGTTGPSPDPDGYTLLLDGAEQGPLGVSASDTLAGLSPGAHQVALTGMAMNCAVAGDNPRTVTITAGAVADVSFAVTCAPSSGSITVTTATTGSSLDPDGYSLTVDSGPSKAIAVNAALVVEDLAVGTHALTLSGIAYNCHVDGENPRQVEVSPGSTTVTAYSNWLRAHSLEANRLHR